MQAGAEPVDKCMVVVGGFENKSMEEAKNMLADLMKHAHGFQELHVIASDPPIGFVHFARPIQAMKFIRGQEHNVTMRDHNLWASEKTDRRLKGRGAKPQAN